MSFPSKLGLTLAGAAAIGVGAVLWARFGTLVYFDVVAASFIGCFF